MATKEQQRDTQTTSKELSQHAGWKTHKKPQILNTEQDLLNQFHSFRPKNPLKGPLELDLKITFPWKQSDTKKVRDKLRLPKDTKPNCCNLAKKVIKIMTQLKFWENDAQIVSLSVSKEFGDNPGYFVFVCKI